MAGVLVTIGGTTVELQKALRDANGAIALNAEALKELEQVARKTGEGAKAGHGVYIDFLKDTKKELREHTRLFGFFGKELASTGLIGREAGGLIAGAFGALTGPVGVALFAIEGIRAAVDLYKEHAKELDEQHKKSIEVLTRLGEKYDEVRNKRLGITDEHIQTGRLEVAEKAISKRDAANMALSDAPAMTQAWRDASESLDHYREKVRLMEQQLGIMPGMLQQWISEQRRLVDELKKEEEHRRTTEEHRLQGQSRLTAATSEEQRIRIEAQNKIQELNDQLGGKVGKEHQLHQSINNVLEERKKKLDDLRIKMQFLIQSATEGEGYDLKNSPEQLLANEAFANARKHMQTPQDLRNEGMPFGGHTADQYADSFSQSELDMGGSKADHEAASAKFKQDLEETKLLTQQYMTGITAVVSSVAGTITGVFDDLILNSGKKWQGFAQTLENLFRAVGASILRGLVDMGLKLALEAAKDAITAHLLSKPAKVAEVLSQSAVVGAGTAAALALDPVTALGAIPAGVAAMEAAQASFLPIAFASQGYDIPGTINPLVQAHASEMVLPARYADVIRDMADGGGGGITLNVNAMDARSFNRYLKDNPTALVEALVELRRAGRSV